MIEFRPFRNTDPPLLADLWCSQPPQRALVQPMTTTLFEQKVLSKPYFDREGLIVALDGTRMVGFAHAAFGPTPDGSAVDTQTGTTCLLMVGRHTDRQHVAQQLLTHCERYLARRGAQTWLAGCVRPVNPFYQGLYGDTDSPGLFESDTEAVRLFQAAGYQTVQTRVVLERTLQGFRPILDRLQMQVRRQYLVQVEVDPPAANWWDACTTELIERRVHRIVSRRSDQPCGRITSWEMDRVSVARGVRAAGLMLLEIDPDYRGQGLGTFLLGETLRWLHTQSARPVELAVIQIPEDNRAARSLFEKLGFQAVDRSLVLRKTATRPAD